MAFFVQMYRPEPIVDRMIEPNKDEYMTRHLIDGRIVTCDQRISLIAGYMLDEVSGHSAFKYMHRDDVRWVMIALRQSKLFGRFDCSFPNRTPFYLQCMIEERHVVRLVTD